MTTLADTTAARWIKRAAFLSGLVLAGGLLASWQVPRADGSARVDVVFLANLTGELRVAPTGPVLEARDMEAGSARRSASGRLTVRNQTPVAIAVRPRVRPTSRALDDLMGVELASGGRSLYHGSLGRLRPGAPRTVALRPGQRAAITLRAWLSRSARGRYLVRSEDISLELPARRMRR